MLFSSITFLYFFFPITLLLYYVVPKRHKNVVLCLASFFFYAWGEPGYCILLLLYGVVAYVAGRMLTALPEEHRMRKYALIISIVLFAGGLFYFKYAAFVWDNLNYVLGGRLSVLRIALPIGISFYTFQVISYVIDVYNGKIESETEFLTFLTYLSMFPQLIAGPIVRFEEVKADLNGRNIKKEKVAKGIRRLVIGLSKKVLLADELAQMADAITEQQINNPVAYWLLAIAFMLQIYFDFSGYSDMAIGMGQMLGFSFPENFNYPFISKSISEFWRRWHMTLSRFLRDYLYIPLGGNRVPYKRWVLNMLIVWGVSGIWHGAGWNFLMWGLFFGICLILEKKLTGNYQRRLPAVLQHTYTLFLLVISFVIFGNDSMADVIRIVYRMFCWSNVQQQLPAVWFVIRNYGVLLLVSVVAATPLYQKLISCGKKNGSGVWLFYILENAWYFFCFFLSTAFLINHSFHPFLYFRF